MKVVNYFQYALLAMPLAMLGIPMFLYLPQYFHHEYALSLTLIGSVLFFARVLDVFTDPAIGWFCDMLSRYLHYFWQVVLGVVLLVTSVYQLFFPTGELSGLSLFVWSFLVYFAWTWVQVPYSALLVQQQTLPQQKSQLAASREVFAVFGVLLVLTLPIALNLNIEGKAFYEVLFWYLLLLFSLAVVVLMFYPREVLNHSAQQSMSPWQTLKKMRVEHPSAFRIMPSYFINNLANAFPATLFVFFVSDYLQLSEDKGIFLLVYFLSGVLALPIWLMLAKKWGKKNAWMTSVVLASIFFTGVFWLQAGDYWGFIIICVLTGLSLGIDLAIPTSMQADVAAEIQQNNQQVSGLLFGLWGMLTKLALALAIGISLPLLDWLKLIDLNSYHLGLLVLYAGLPILLKIWVGFSLFRMK